MSEEAIIINKAKNPVKTKPLINSITFLNVPKISISSEKGNWKIVNSAVVPRKTQNAIQIILENCLKRLVF
jgi:hypothetical protein